MAKEIAEEYTSSLADLTLNSKPLINMLTMLADDNIEHATSIVEAVEKHLEKVRSEFKLPVLYLIDSIVKNVGRAYTQLFTQNIVNSFCSVFEKVDEKVRAQMFKLRQTWNEVFPAKKLYALDVRVQCIDPAWPITAPPPTLSIHVNPRFFNNPSTPSPETPTIVTPAISSVDPATIDMQAQLINKHKELLELKQKKLELELLQAKAKLEEQQKQLERQSQQIKQPQNLLLKPEVSKQLAEASFSSSSKADKTKSQVTNHVLSKATTTALGNSNAPTLPRITPISSAMLAATRPTLRDPRLSRQQPTFAAGVPPPQNTSNNIETVIIDEKHKVKKPSTTISIDCANNKINKAGAISNTLTRKDPRLSKQVPGSKSNKSSNGRPASSDRSPTKSKSSPTLSRKSGSKSLANRNNSSSFVHVKGSSTNNSSSTNTSDSNNSNSSKSVIPKDKGSSESNSNNSSSSLSSSSSASPTKLTNNKKRESGDSIKSELSNKSSRNSKKPITTSGNSQSVKSRRFRDKYIDSADPAPATAAASSPPTADSAPDVAEQRSTFKGLKLTAKNRNYIRRNRAQSISPEPTQDVDLRLSVPPPEKQPRLAPDPPAVQVEEVAKSATIDDSPNKNKDVDLRTLVPLAISKKRPSTEKSEGSGAKKSKSFDVLFGNEDVDLRQLPPVLSPPPVPVSTSAPSAAVVCRPPTPPPPIISSSVTPDKAENKENAAAVPASTSTKSSLDAIRQKLANASKISAKLNEEAKKTPEDTDMRFTAEDALQKIIISSADEQLIKKGHLSQALVERVLTLFETQKLQEAQRRDSEETNRTDFANITLTPISDDELSVDFSHSDSEEDPRKMSPKNDNEAKIPPAPIISGANTISSKEESTRMAQATLDTTTTSSHTLNNRIPHPFEQSSQQQQQPWQQGKLPLRRRKLVKTHWDSPPPQMQQIPQMPPMQILPDPWLRPPPILTNNQAMFVPGMRRPFPQFVRPPIENFVPPRMDLGPPCVMDNRNMTSSPPTLGSTMNRELPLADPLVVEFIDTDTMRAINIDGRLREIRYYDETAIAIMSWDDPREISFQSGSRMITFDDKESFCLNFNDTYQDVTVGGLPHRIRLGAPTREFYIDGKWYECFFGGPGIGIEIDGKMCVVKMDGPPPHVKIGNTKRTDLVAGKISLIINARTMIPIFLDSKPQKFDIEGKIHTLRFVNALRTVLLNEVPFKVEFGGLPKPISVHDKKHFIRFSVLPKGIKPGYARIANMEGQCLASASPPRIIEESNENDENNLNPENMINEPALPMFGKRKANRSNDHDNSPDSSRNSPVMQSSSFGTLDVLSSIMTSPMANSSNVSGYQVDQDSQDGFSMIGKSNSNEIPGFASSESNQSALQPLPFLPTNFNINELFQKLVQTGIVATEKAQQQQALNNQHSKYGEHLTVHESNIKPVLFSQPETLKLRQMPIITAQYAGMQCSSCGVRFPPESSVQYSQHLDWHFRQNRRGRNSARKALCRKWYYDVSDWKNYEEIEDIEEREKNWFESQQLQQTEGTGEDGEEEIEIPSVPADSNSQETCCEICHDKFEQFYNEEKEEWHLRMAIRVEDKTYHPLCHDDYQASLLMDTTATSIETKDETANTTTDELEIPDVKKDDDNSLDIVEITDEVLEEKKVQKIPGIDVEPDEEEVAKKEEKEEKDDDVIIEEPKIEQIIIDEDDVEVLTVGEDNMTDNKSEMNASFLNIKIKQEPLDDDEMCLAEIKDISSIPADTTHAELVSSIDGNVQLNHDTPISSASSIPGRIKINITKPMIAPKEPVVSEPASTTATPEQNAEIPCTVETTAPLLPAPITASNNEPLPPGEEPIQLNLKPALKDVKLLKQLPVQKGTELTGLCSIM